MSDLSAFLSDAAREALEINADAAYGKLVPEGSYRQAKAMLERLAREGAVADATDRDMNRAIEAAIWLWHDFLDESHTISQSIETPEGSYWHAIMHRREGDFWNSKYWLRRVGVHEILARIAAEGGDFIDRNQYAAPLYPLVEHTWDAAAFVDVCEELHNRPDDPRYRAAVELQKIEWQALFAHCARLAAG